MWLLPSEQEDSEAQRRGETGLLEIAEDYRITVVQVEDVGEVRMIVPSRDRSRSQYYYPFNYPELPSQLADVHEGDEAGTLAFVRRWGMLGYGVLYFREASTEQIKEQAERLGGIWGDPLQWVWWHAAQFRRLLELLDALRSPDQGHIEIWLESHAPQGAFRYLASMQDRTIVLGPATRGHAHAGAQITQEVINANTFHHLVERLEINDLDTGRLILSHRFGGALLPVIYGHLRNAALGVGGYYQCAYRHCSRWWPLPVEGRGPKRRFCPPPEGYTESVCGRKERYYAARDKEAC